MTKWGKIIHIKLNQNLFWPYLDDTAGFEDA